MRVLVTGGAGFIGSHLVALLVSEGRSVRVLERNGADVRHLPARIELMRGDIRDRQSVREAVRGCEEVYHLAANPQLWVKPRRLFREINFIGAVNVLEEAVAAGARRILHTSTESILTRSRQAGPIREDQVVPPGDVIGPYCRSKYRAECHAFELARQGAPIVVVNPTLPVGPGDNPLMLPNGPILRMPIRRHESPPPHPGSRARPDLPCCRLRRFEPLDHQRRLRGALRRNRIVPRESAASGTGATSLSCGRL